MNGTSSTQPNPDEGRRRLTHYQPLRPPPADPVPWRTTAPFSHREMKPGTTRHTELIRRQLKIEDARTDFELRFIIDHSLPNDNIWPPNTLAQQEAAFPKPKYDPQWKSDVYMKRELEDFILNEDLPIVSRLEALIDRLFLCHHFYSRFDLVEKGLAMCHELKFKIQGDADWGKILTLEYSLRRRQYPQSVQNGCETYSKDKYDPRTWKPAFDTELAEFIKDQLAEQMLFEGYDIDREFSRIFGLESSARVHRGESPVRWEGYDPQGPVDWGYFRVRRATNGITNGHRDEDDRSVEDDDEDEEMENEEEEDEEDEEQWDGEEVEDEVDEEESEDGLEEISAEAFRASSVARESSSDIEITAIQSFNPPEKKIEDYSEDEELSHVSTADQSLDEETEGAYDEEGGYESAEHESEDGMSVERIGDVQRTTEHGQVHDTSEADSDELEIIEEHHHGSQKFGRQSRQDQPVHAMRDTRRSREDDIDGPEEFTDDITDSENGGRVDYEGESEEITDRYSAEGSEGETGEDENEYEDEDENSEMVPEPPLMPQIAQLRASAQASELSSPLSSLDDEEISRMEDTITAYAVPITDVATRALERAVGISSVKASDTSGLSSPPSSPSSLNSKDEEAADGENGDQGGENGGQEAYTDAGRQHNTRLTQISQSHTSIEIDPALLNEDFQWKTQINAQEPVIIDVEQVTTEAYQETELLTTGRGDAQDTINIAMRGDQATMSDSKEEKV